MSFIEAGIPAFFFFSGRHNDLHTIGDDPEKIDYPKAASICRLGYLVTERLGNMKVIPTFKPPVDPTIKNLSAEPIWAINSKANWSMVNNSIALYSTTERTVGTDTNHSVLHAVDLSNGKELWNNKLNSIFSYYYPPVIEKNIIYFHTYILKKPEGSYFGIDLNSGQIVFEYVINNSNQLRVHNNILFVKEKELIALDIATKDVIWKFGTKSSSVTDYDIDQENVYIEFTGPSGPNKDETGQNLCALKIRSGEKLWEYQIDRAYTNPRVYGNLVCFWGRDHLYGINKVDGQKKWRFNINNEWKVATAQSGNHIYVVSGRKGELFCLDSKHGDLVWTFSTSSLFYKKPIFHKNQVILIDGEEKCVIGLEKNTGKQLWEFSLPFKPTTYSTENNNRLLIHSEDGIYCYDISKLN